MKKVNVKEELIKFIEKQPKFVAVICCVIYKDGGPKAQTLFLGQGSNLVDGMDAIGESFENAMNDPHAGSTVN